MGSACAAINDLLAGLRGEPVPWCANLQVHA